MNNTDTYIEINLVSNGKTKRYVLPHSPYLEIEDVKKQGVKTLSGDIALESITDYHRFIITTYNGYSEADMEDK
jgi:hypothetical protein